MSILASRNDLCNFRVFWAIVPSRVLHCRSLIGMHHPLILVGGFFCSCPLSQASKGLNVWINLMQHLRQLFQRVQVQLRVGSRTLTTLFSVVGIMNVYRSKCRRPSRFRYHISKIIVEVSVHRHFRVEDRRTRSSCHPSRSYRTHG